MAEVPPHPSKRWPTPPELSESDALWGEDIAIELWNAGPGNKIHDVECNTWLSIVSHPNVFN